MVISAEAITAIIAQESGIDAARLTPEAKLADLDIGSLDMASVAFEIEDQLAVAVDPDKIDPAFTVAQFVDYVRGLAPA